MNEIELQIGWFVLSAICSWLLTGVLLKYAIHKQLIDIPNNRSSHKTPIPRGGGMAFVLTFIAGLVVVSMIYTLNTYLMLSVFGSGVLVAGIGFIDDHKHISPWLRLTIHFLAALWVLIWIGKLPTMTFFGVTFHPGLIGYLFVLFMLVWLINLFNFMDGIDGIASVEAIFIAGCGYIFSFNELDTAHQLVAVILIGTTLGFLVWNWPPAKIFMGDVGSGFLGITLGIYAYWMVRDDVVTYWSWAIIMGVFLVDASFTLIRRILRKQRWYAAHRSHAYQHAAQRWGHLPVTLAITLINIFWLLPIAYFSNQYRDLGPELMILALTPLIVLAFVLGAGKET